MQEEAALVLTDSISRFLAAPNKPCHLRAPQFFSTGKGIGKILLVAKQQQQPVLVQIYSMYKISEGWLSLEVANKNL